MTDATVIIPTAGGEPGLLEAIEALHWQSMSNPPRLEVLVVDKPGPLSISRDLVTAWNLAQAKHDPDPAGFQVRYVVQDNDGGQPGAMNQGARLASSDVLIFQDADVSAAGGLVREVLEILDDPDVGFVSAKRAHREVGWSMLTEPFLPSIGFTTTWFGAMRQKVFCEMGGWGQDYLCDVDFWVRSRQAGGLRVVFAQHRVVAHRRIRHEVRKTGHLLKHLVDHPHAHGPAPQWEVR